MAAIARARPGDLRHFRNDRSVTPQGVEAEAPYGENRGDDEQGDGLADGPAHVMGEVLGDPESNHAM